MYRKIISILIFLIFIFSLAFSNLQLYTASENYIYSLGDVDLDGRVTTSDARLALMAASGIEKLSEASFRNADYNGDGTISVYDARSILYISLDMENQIIPENGESVRAVWVSIAGGDFPSYDNLSANKLKQEIDAIVDNVYSYGLNTIYFQVRSHSDSMYNSSIFPTASALVENQGDTAPMDVLEYFIEKAHSKNIELHAWINPYRVSSRSHSTSSLAGTNPAVLHPDWIVKHFNDDGSEGGIFYDPALPEVRRLVVDGVMEIVENYDVDGIHFDDYFYPYNNAKNFEDNSSYEKYGEGKNRDDWRRENVDLLVRNVYTSIKNSKPSVKFGISPFGVWAKKTASCPEGTEGLGWPLQSYSDIYADTRNWIVNGWVDYISVSYTHLDKLEQAFNEFKEILKQNQ